MTYHQVLTERPPGCRYAVVSTFDNLVQVWDLYETHAPKEPKIVFEWIDVDVATTYIQMRYDCD